MVPVEFLQANGYLYKAFKIISKIMKSVYNETEVEKSVVADMEKLRKAVLRRSRSNISIRKVEKAKDSSRIGRRKLGKFHAFMKKNIRRYRKKHYDLSQKEVFKILVMEWKSARRRRK